MARGKVAPEDETILWRGREALYLAVGVVMGLLARDFIDALARENFAAFFQSLLPEMVGITFTILIINRLDAKREYRLIRSQLVRRAHSRYNPVALAAIEELRVMEYLQDGALAGKNLRGADWSDANLYEADLSNCDLTNAVLDRADLIKANLTGAQVKDEQLASAIKLHLCTMPDGKRYNGRFRLPGDIDLAHRKGVDTESMDEMAAWYQVPLEEYIAGQNWYFEHQGISPLPNPFSKPPHSAEQPPRS